MQPAAAAQAPVLPPGGMLSRIGSMKRWGRRKKGSSMSVGSEMEAETDVIRDITADINADLTPRRSMSQRSPSSSCSRNRHSYHTGTPSTPARRGSLYTPQTPPNPSSNPQPKTPATGDNGGWFFRGPSPGRRRFRSRSTSRTRDERRPHTPTPLPDFSGPKSKLLVKQHPGSFVPIGRGRHPGYGDEKTAGRSLHPSPTKYGALGVGRPSSTGVGSSSVEDLGRKMGFVERSVRKISLVGGQKHKRTKSATGLEETEQPSSTTPGLEIQPPSPPQTMNAATGSRLTGTTFSLASTTSLPSTALQPSKSPLKSNHSRPVTPVMQVHPQSTASLGRSSAAVAAAITASPSAMRRNSLGDLKIPARISQAQGALRRDLGMVREFARNVEDLKELQSTYQSLVAEVQAVLDARLLPAAPTSPSPSPSFFKRHRSNASLSTPPPEAWKQLAAAFYTINSRYRISWECAELLIELGGAGSSAGPPSSTSAPAIPPTSTSSKKSRARAITLTDDSAALPTSASLPTASTPSLAWRASTGRSMHSNAELNSRQMALLKELLSSPSAADDSFGTDDGVPEGTVVNRDWRWGADAMGSTITLPSEEDHGSGKERVKEKRRKSSKMRMSGFRDLLKSLARSGSGGASSSSSNPSHHPNPIPSTTSFSTDSSSQSRSTHNSTHSRRRAKTSTGPEIISLKPGSPYNSAKTASASPRRPSLASIFRIGRNKTPTGMPNESSSEGVSHDEGEEDWDRLSSEAEQQHPQQTIRGRNRSPYLHPALLPNSNTSLGANGATVVTRITRLSNVNETVEDASQPPSPVFSPPPPTGTKTTRRPAKNTGSVRSMPPSASSSDAVLAMMTAGKLAMTPENIKPLLENAREVHARLMECIEEVRALVDGLENQKV
ncbi:unnamed protein product [Mycena citricolor]|uniref:Uncharacterized protein n=1 Tax=Mycena citricolor TaxID=2018698 RepID=A0AAD2H1S3_9AGAR|nr:unnamed protein product [Mycena citricolor]